MRLLNFSSEANKYIFGFFQNNNRSLISSTDFKNRLHHVVKILQQHFVNPCFWDGRCRIFSQLCNRPDPNKNVYTFLPPKSMHPVWIGWSNSGGFQDGIYPPPSSTKDDLYAFLFEVRM